MLDPMKKGPLTFNNTVDIRGYSKVNLLAAVFLIMYGPAHESLFEKATIKTATQQRNALFMEGAEIVVDRRTALKEVYATFLQQSILAKSAFDATTDFSSTDEDLQAVLESLKNGEVQRVSTVEELVEKAPVVEKVDTDKSDVKPVGEYTDTTDATNEIVVETEAREDIGNSTESVDKPEDMPVPTVEKEQYEVEEKFCAETKEESTPSLEETTKQTEEPVSVAPRYSEDLVILSDDNEYEKALRGKLTAEVRDFKVLPNTYSAVRLCNKIVALLPGKDLLDIVYNKEAIHVLYEEFEGAAYLLSSFRILAVGIATGGVKNV